MYDFETLVDRRGTGASKWVNVTQEGELEDIVPLSVADMEFIAPPEVRAALHEVVDRGVYGYQNADDDYFESARRWYARRQGWTPEKEWLVPAQGVVQALAAAIMLFAKPGEGVIIQEPVYYPFRYSIECRGRHTVNNPLIESKNPDGTLHYSIDFDGLEKLAAADDVKLMLFCNPHNPVSRVWTLDEVRRVAEICKKHDVILLSDEIHGDLIMSGYKLSSVMLLEPELRDNAIVCTAPSKTFNQAGLMNSNIWVPGKTLRDAYNTDMYSIVINGPSNFARAAMMAAYDQAEGWLDELLAYVEENDRYLKSRLKEAFPKVNWSPLEGTYLAWTDWRAYFGEDADALEKFAKEKAHIAFDEGKIFGVGGAGFERWNLACPRRVLERAIDRFIVAAKDDPHFA